MISDMSADEAEVIVAGDDDVTQHTEDDDPGRHAGEEVTYDLGPDSDGGA
jgi:hypothetical protein